MFPNRIFCMGSRNAWRLIFKQCHATLDGPDAWSGWLRHGHHAPTRHQQGAGEVTFRADSWGQSWLFSDGVKMTLDIFGFSDWPLSPMVQKGPCFPTQKHLHARQWTITSCEEYICIIGCYGHHKNHAVPHPPLTSTLWRTFGAFSSKRSMRVRGSSCPDNNSRRLFWPPTEVQAQTRQGLNRCKNCEAAAKWGVCC